MKASAKIFFDTRREKKNGKYPVKIEIYCNRHREYYPTRFEYTKVDYPLLFIEPKELKAALNIADAKEKKKVIDVITADKAELDSLLTKAREVIKELGSFFSFEQFDRKFLSNRMQRGNVFAVYEEMIENFRSNEQYGTADNYKNSMNSLKAFSGKDKLMFERVTPDFLHKYEKWMLTEGNMRIGKKGEPKKVKGASRTTVSMYTRALKAVFNKAIADGEISDAAYPFGRKRSGYVIPSGRNYKRALKPEDIGRIMNYAPEKEEPVNAAFARDMWALTYFGHGVNLKDIAHFRYRNISGNAIVFIRAKTANTRKEDEIQIKIDLDDDIKAIIKRWGNKNTDPDNFIFPILKKSMDAQQQHKAVKQALRTINKFNKRLGVALGLDLKLTTYSARHSYANVLMNAGATPLYASKKMGNSEATIKNYFGDFVDDIDKKFKEALKAYKNFETDHNN